jgi:hypothetical protein
VVGSEVKLQFEMRENRTSTHMKRLFALASNRHRVTSSSHLRWYLQSGFPGNSISKQFCVRS